ncbi:Protein angel 2 [Allomyces javanicus]|nr:Protein angel 2 [Allomyces javanicus]
MSYNVLADNLLFKNRYLYPKNAPMDWLRWDQRWQRIVRQVREHDPDVICMQEIHQKDLVRDIAPDLLTLGYHYHYQQRTQNADAHQDGVATFYRADRLTCVQAEPVTYFHAGTFLDRDNVGMVLRLVLPKHGIQFMVANTHILFNPRRGAVKVGQIHTLLTRIHAMLDAEALPAECEDLSIINTDPTDVPVFVCGDFNSAPHSAVYHFVASGAVDLAAPDDELAGQRADFDRAVNWWSGSSNPADLRPTAPAAATLAQSLTAADLQEQHTVESITGGTRKRGARHVVPRYATHPFDLHSLYRGSDLDGRVSSAHTKSRDLVDFVFHGRLGVRHGDDASVHPRRYVPRDWTALVAGIPPVPGFVRAAHRRASRRVDARAVRLLQLPKVRDARPIPDAVEGSDHYPIAGEFELVVQAPTEHGDEEKVIAAEVVAEEDQVVATQEIVVE